MQQQRLQSQQQQKFQSANVVPRCALLPRWGLGVAGLTSSAAQRLTQVCVCRRSRVPAVPGQQQQQQWLLHVPHVQQLQQQPPSWVCKSSAAAAGGGGEAGKPSSAGPVVVFSPLEQKLGALCKNLTNLFPL